MKCNICDKTTFLPGPGGRTSRSGLNPLCSWCRSLERHRIGRSILEILKGTNRFAQLDALDLSNEKLLDHSWARSVQCATADIDGRLDTSTVELKKNSYGLIIASNILERVKDPIQLLQQLAEALKPTGLMYLAFPSPLRTPRTNDWGFSDPKKHGHYRVFGRDFETELEQATGHAHVIAVEAADPVTSDTELVYVVTRSRKWAGVLLSSDLSTRLVA